MRPLASLAASLRVASPSYPQPTLSLPSNPFLLGRLVALLLLAFISAASHRAPANQRLES